MVRRVIVPFTPEKTACTVDGIPDRVIVTFAWKLPFEQGTLVSEHLGTIIAQPTDMSPRSTSYTRSSKVWPLLITVLFAFAILLGTSRANALEEMSRSQIINLAQSGTGFSYWWGKGIWSATPGAAKGSCSGTCPRCSHSGSYGADCSGFVAKVWNVPWKVPVNQNSHPYSTSNFRYETTHWTRIDRGASKQGDAMVYRAGKSGHIVLYDRDDPWGTMWTYECKGCAAGCVHNLRTVANTYIAIRRKSLVNPAISCTEHDECNSGLCSWNGDMYCCRNKGFTGKACFSDGECSGSEVCAYNGTDFVCTNPVQCSSNPTEEGTGGSSGSAGTGGSGGGSPPGGCGSSLTADPWQSAGFGPSMLLMGIAGVIRRRRRNGRS